MNSKQKFNSRKKKMVFNSLTSDVSVQLSCSVMSDSLQPHRRQPTRLSCPWDSPGKNTGVGCHFLRQCMKVKIESEVAQLCPTICKPKDCSMPGFSVHHEVLELIQTHVHRVGDAIQPSHPLLSPSPAFYLSQHQGLFK